MIFTWKILTQDLKDNIKNNIKHRLIVFGIKTVNMVIVTLQDTRAKHIIQEKILGDYIPNKRFAAFTFFK